MNSLARTLRVAWRRGLPQTLAHARDWVSGPRAPRDSRRWLLPALLALVTAVLATLIWLASVYETAQAQEDVERHAAVAALDIRQGLARNLQSLQALQIQPADASTWAFQAGTLLFERRELRELRWLDADFRQQAQAVSPYEPLPGVSQERPAQVQLTCTLAAQNGQALYSTSYFVTGGSAGQGQELVDVCQVIRNHAAIVGYQVATYSLRDLLSELVAKPVQRAYEVSFTDMDGARLAVINNVLRRNSRPFISQQVIELPGASLTLRLVYWHSAPSLFPNVLTGMVTFLAIALATVADALAFRNAMENSLITGLRARDLSGRINYVNPAFCEMVGFRDTELLGSDMPAPYWPPENVDLYMQRQALLRGADRLPPRIGYESVFMRRDGTRFPVLIYEAPLLDASGQRVGWMSAVIDISEQRRMEEISRASQERLQATARLATVGEMASLISHEINQPLAAIASYATGSLNLLGRDAAADVPAQAPQQASQQARALRMAIQQIVAQAERAGKVVTSVRDFVQRRHRAYEPVRPQQLQQALEPLLNLQARKLGVELLWQMPPSLPAVRCDRIMVEQVLLNLARNGMQAMDLTPPSQRRLVIRAEQDDTPGLLRFSVADWGSGIAPELSEQLFNHFFSTKREGLGLGLSLCRTVVEQHGGQLGFEPNTPCGTIFRFTLPLQPAVETVALPAAGIST
ncbi:MAG: Sensor protein FixL [Paracidovorax wautersii]|uniref:histidine kinase n=1 Tax=Paracidovorax wautersii TaxID=1177982 RepID=A0A7V8FNT3_9BURK|nr:MAG: Sensor protein FixL [Paracidovorax wautersii]